MKNIVRLYFNYLELIIIGMVVAGLGATLVAGIRARSEALSPEQVPAVLSFTIVLSAITLLATGITIVVTVIRRHGVLTEHPELSGKLFREFRLLNFAFKNKRVLFILPVLVLVTLVATAYTDKLLKNQAIVEAGVVAGVNYPATAFNEKMKITVVEISPENNGNPAKVTALLQSGGHDDKRIENQEVGYRTTYLTDDLFIVRIVEITNSSAKFFVERRASRQRTDP